MLVIRIFPYLSGRVRFGTGPLGGTTTRPHAGFDFQAFSLLHGGHEAQTHRVRCLSRTIFAGEPVLGAGSDIVGNVIYVMCQRF